jgi:hypothetical protein
MPVLALWRMSLLRLLRLPWAWGLLGMFLLAPPFLLQLRPLASDLDALEVLRAWAFPAGLIGTALALGGLEARAAFLQRVELRDRLVGELGSCLLSGLLLQLPTILGVLSVCSPPRLDLGRALADILSIDLHCAGLALLSLTLPMPASARPLSLCVLAWVLPALLPSGTPRALLVLLEPAAPLRAPAAMYTSIAVGLGLTLAVALWRTRQVRAAR